MIPIATRFGSGVSRKSFTRASNGFVNLSEAIVTPVPAATAEKTPAHPSCSSTMQMAFVFCYSVFQGYAPDTDLDNVRDRVVGILFGLVVTGLVFKYIWPEWSERGERHIR
jgi:hypothetical protein